MAAGNKKLRVSTLLILYVTAVLLGAAKESCGAKACPLYCLDVSYMTCPSSGDQQLTGECNCCLAPKGCTLHLKDGSSVKCKT